MTHRFKNRLAQLLALSLIGDFLSLKVLPTFRQILSKTLDFLRMDSLFFSVDGADEDSLYGNSSFRSIQSLSDLDDERLYLVDHRWWNEARESMFKEVDGVLYATSSSLSDDFESEIVLELSRNDSVDVDCNGEEQRISGREYALISEWMFYRALKWHYDLKKLQNSIPLEDNKTDLFVLQIRLSISEARTSLLVRICEKDNKVLAFNKSRQIFMVNTGVFKIWDFSGQITKFFLQDKMIPDDSVLANKESSLELQVYGLSHEMAVDLKIEPKVNGCYGKVNSYTRLSQQDTSNFHEAFDLGLTGLYNLGNTCFMNSAIQCLVHTPQLVDYFLGDFRKDLNFENPLGMNGKLALAFGDLLRQLWTPGTTSVDPRAFKSVLAGFAPQFSGYNQHDSQEFLAFLLDGLHEDLNRVKIKPYNEIKDMDEVSDQEVANEHWRNHLARNDSIIVDMCQGQYRSTLICPFCKKHSVTFDPFLYLSLPLPSTTMRTMTLTVLSTDGSTLPVPVTVTVPKFGKFKDLIQALSSACCLGDDETLLVAEIYNNCILHYLDKPDDSLELVRDHDQLVAYRLRKDQDSLALVVFTHCHFEEVNGQPLKRFGIPLAARIPECSDGFELRNKFLQLLNPLIMPEDFSSDSVDDCAVNIADPDTKMDDVAVDDMSNSSEVGRKSSVDEDFHFSLEKQGSTIAMVQIAMDEPLLIPKSRKLSILVSWPEEMSRRYDTCILDRLPETGGGLLLTSNPPESVSLYKCLEAFLKEEPLGPEDMWYCPKCEDHRQASKKLDLWRFPEVLIIHLKRFSYNRFLKDKLETFVDFPVVDFDLSNYTVHKDDRRSSLHYKLYAVSNHYGGMGGGHYTAFAQCGEQWYEFNDSQVFPISEDQIKTSAAYVLFYKRV